MLNRDLFHFYCSPLKKGNLVLVDTSCKKTTGYDRRRKLLIATLHYSRSQKSTNIFVALTLALFLIYASIASVYKLIASLDLSHATSMTATSKCTKHVDLCQNYMMTAVDDSKEDDRKQDDSN